LAAAGGQEASVRPSVETAKCWTFTQWGDKLGWSVPPRLTGAVMGGGLWLTIAPQTTEARQLEQVRYQVYGDPAFWNPAARYEIESPPGLKLPAASLTKVRMRLINLSPVTDGFVRWRTTDDAGKDAGAVRFTMKPDSKEWLDVVCHVDGKWRGTVDRISLQFGTVPARGDIWIHSICITGGPPRADPSRPDVRSDRVVPVIDLPGIAQADFQDAFHVLDECLIVNVPVFGFTYPVMGPGGAYGENWWQLDSSLNVAGAKWANQKFAEGVMRGFRDVQAQNPDGRIDLYGGCAVRGQISDVSSLPRLFEAGYDVARRTGDAELRVEIYTMLKRYLDWWLSSAKREARTGLVTGTFEEMLSETPPHAGPDGAAQAPQTIAPVDLNVAVAVGCSHVAALAQALHKSDDVALYTRAFQALKDSINRYLWNEQAGAYFSLNVKESKLRPRMICSMFDTLRLGIAPPERVKALLGKLLDPTMFNWGKLPVTSIARTEPDYVEARGAYDGRSWFGDVWSMRNMAIIAGLQDAGRHDLASELCWTTVKAFNRNFTEYLVPSTGEGEGVKRYGWSASQYVQAIVENLFGVDYDALRRRLRIVPHVPRALFGRRIALSRLILPGGRDTRLGVTITQTAPGQAEIAVEISGEIPPVELEILLPKGPAAPTRFTDEKRAALRLVDSVPGLANVAGVRLPARRLVRVRME
jgi:hypothetical protein